MVNDHFEKGQIIIISNSEVYGLCKAKDIKKQFEKLKEAFGDVFKDQ